MSTKKKLLTGGGVLFLLLVIIGALAPPVEDDAEVIEATPTTTTEAEAIASTTSEPAPTTTTAPIEIDNDVFFQLVMSTTDQSLLADICPTYTTLDRAGREVIVATTFTPSQDLSVYEGWTGTDLTLAAADWFDTACGID